jgi:hypothetical protein
MRIVGFNFKKISVEESKKDYKQGELKIKTSIDVPEIKELKSDFLKTKDQVLEIEFLFSVDYEPKVAKVELKGRLFLSVEPKLAKEILRQWKKKKMPEDFRHILFNIILKKSTLKALSLEEELNLPLHMPLPSFRRKK